MAQEFDKGSKWLLEHQGRGLLLLAGMQNVQSVQAVQAEVVQPRRLPDGLLRVTLRGEKKPLLVLVEVATYAEPRVLTQALGDVAVASAVFGEVPELLVVVLRPRGKLRIPTSHTIKSRLGTTELTGEWQVTELWTIPAERILESDEVGLTPWVPLCNFKGLPETILRKCKEKIEKEAPEDQRSKLLSLTQVFTRLRYPEQSLLAILGEPSMLIPPEVIEDYLAARIHPLVIRVLTTRFQEVPIEITNLVQSVIKEKPLQEIFETALTSPDLASFKETLLTILTPRSQKSRARNGNKKS